MLNFNSTCKRTTQLPEITIHRRQMYKFLFNFEYEFGYILDTYRITLKYNAPGKCTKI